ncbi:hypothetical protein FIBSPDRAFT_1050356 [Athelia psychrophila]|uniref:F-box domain-containing protein n=1 Tax=Athelia psychrophila TaxID=1759441 RepID=A0A166AXS1_9AGAM|nr:hypothetical protein FIBSPDRAFT_1050356 [Fibularhizoctonia sp. CBS 109695]
MPLLSSIELGCDRYLTFDKQLFPSGVPRLTTACIHSINIRTIHHCLSAFGSLTSLQLKALIIYNHDNDMAYSLFRDALMAMPSLHHLDLSIKIFEASPGRLPILLPRIQHLHAHCNGYMIDSNPLSSLLHSITAASLVALSLSNQRDSDLLELITHASKPHFPSLQHLILTNVSSKVQHLTALAQAFPDIERLTFTPDHSASAPDINRIFDTFLCGAGPGDTAENGAPLWPKVQSIALSTFRERFAVPQLKSKILQLQAAGHHIRKLLLPQYMHPAMVEVGEIIALEEFYVDWPTPFEW